MKTCTILAVTPYAGLNNIFLKVSKEYANVSLELYEEKDGGTSAEMAAAARAKGADVIIAWGSYAQELCADDIPVVNLQLTFSDLLHALKAIDRIRGKHAFVSYDITGKERAKEYVSDICQLTNFSIQTFDANNAQEMHELLASLKKLHYNVILGGMETVKYAHQIGLNGIQIAYGVECVRNTFVTALLLFQEAKKVESRYDIFRQVLREIPDYAVVQDGDGKILYHNGDKAPKEFEKLSQALSKEKSGFGQFELKTKDIVWEATRKNIVSGEEHKQYTVLLLRRQRFVDLTGGGAITYMDHPESDLITNIYCSTDFGYIKDRIEKYRTNRESILVSGERGLGKENIAFLLNSRMAMLRIDCNRLTIDSFHLLNDEGLRWITESNLSAILLADADVIKPELQEPLTDFLFNLYHQRGVRIISTAWDEIYRKVSRGHFSHRLYHFLSGICVDVPPVRDLIKDMDEDIYYIISFLNIELGLQIVGISNEALDCLKSFTWGSNLRQLVDVLRRSMLASNSSILSLDDVQRMIEMEKSIWSSNRGAAAFWCGNLEEIEKRIIRGILEEEGMNQTKAAERLGISRSTLYRKIK